MRLIALLLGVGMLIWSVDMGTDLFLGSHQSWSTVVGIAVGGLGWIALSRSMRRAAAKQASHDSMFNLTRMAGDTMFAPTMMAPDAQDAQDAPAGPAPK